MSQTPQPFFINDALIEKAIEDFVDESQRQLDLLLATPVRQRTPTERDGITELRRDIKAYERVGDYWEAGIYPLCIDGLWQVRSLSEPGTTHQIWRDGQRWACDCYQGTRERPTFHVHQAMMAVIERALELAEQYSEAPASAPIGPDDFEPEPDIVGDDLFLPDAPRELGRRLAAARAERMAA